MKRILFTVILALFTTSLFAQFLQGFHSVGMNANFCAYYFDGHYALILSFNGNQDTKLTDYAVVKLLLNDGSVMKLEGYNGIEQKSLNAVTIRGISMGSVNEKNYAVFPITLEQIEMLNLGVDRIAINTIPMVYKQSSWFGKKNFGQSLYKDFKRLKGDFDENL